MPSAHTPSAGPSESHLQAALKLFARNEPNQALAKVAQAVAAAVDNNELLGSALLLLRFGRTEQARSVFLKMVENDPGSVPGHAHLAQLDRSHDPARVDTMLAILKTLDPNSSSGVQLAFALAKIFADEGDIDRSFAFYEKANTGRRTQVSFDTRSFQQQLRRFRMEFNRPLFERLKAAGNRNFRPIFIVGMQRSGSTLIEQILASHPAVYGAGELPHVAKIVSDARRKHFRASLADLVAVATPAWIDDMARQYIREVRPLMGKRPRLSDKALGNFWHVGFIRLMFPEAKVIHAVRDPLDCGFSIYRQHFTDSGPGYAYDLAEIGAYFKLHDSMMRHWDEVLPGYVKHVRYENLINDVELVARDILAFCDLPWDDRCLTFHKTERSVETASLTQVRRPIYRNAIGSAQPYINHLQPLVDALR